MTLTSDSEGNAILPDVDPVIHAGQLSVVQGNKNCRFYFQSIILCLEGNLLSLFMYIEEPPVNTSIIRIHNAFASRFNHVSLFACCNLNGNMIHNEGVVRAIAIHIHKLNPPINWCSIQHTGK